MKTISRSNVNELINEGRLLIDCEVEEIEKDAFLPLAYITKLQLLSENQNFIVEKNCLYNKTSGELLFAVAETDCKVLIPDCIKKINMYAFPAGVTQIENIPSSVPEIPIKAAKSWELKAIIEKRNQLVKSKREKIAALKAAMAKKS